MDLSEHLSPNRPAGNAEPRTRAESRIGKRWICGFIIWLAAVSAGVGALTLYSTQPTAHGQAVDRWPVESALDLGAGPFTLLMFLHPGCSCSLASLEELNALLAHAGDRLNARVIFLYSDAMADERTSRALREAAGRLPGIVVVEDPDGAEARRFGAGVSGDTLVYDSAGVLRFRGGITEARGHAGPNAGRLAIEEMAQSGAAARSETPVFGCALFETDMKEPFPAAPLR